jgi:hypothetical protein
MPDITMCNGNDCKLKDKCYRFVADADPHWQSYFIDLPLNEDGSCDHFYPLKRR